MNLAETLGNAGNFAAFALRTHGDFFGSTKGNIWIACVSGTSVGRTATCLS